MRTCDSLPFYTSSLSSCQIEGLLRMDWAIIEAQSGTFGSIAITPGTGGYEALPPLEAADFAGCDGPEPDWVLAIAPAISARSSCVNSKVAA
jgi:hypothetical protein